MIDMVPLRGRVVDAAYLDLMEDAREADKQEWLAASGERTFSEALMEALQRNSHGTAWAARYGPHILMAFGVVEHPIAGIGNAWMICTNKAVPLYRAIHQHYHEYLEQMLSVRPVLHAWADERNVLHHQWMVRRGFKETDYSRKFNEWPFRLFVYSKEMHQACASQA